MCQARAEAQLMGQGDDLFDPHHFAWLYGTKQMYGKVRILEEKHGNNLDRFGNYGFWTKLDHIPYWNTSQISAITAAIGALIFFRLPAARPECPPPPAWDSRSWGPRRPSSSGRRAQEHLPGVDQKTVAELFPFFFIFRAENILPGFINTVFQSKWPPTHDRRGENGGIFMNSPSSLMPKVSRFWFLTLSCSTAGSERQFSLRTAARVPKPSWSNAAKAALIEKLKLVYKCL